MTTTTSSSSTTTSSTTAQEPVAAPSRGYPDHLDRDEATRVEQHPTSATAAAAGAGLDEELNAVQLEYLKAAIERGHVAQLLDIIESLLDEEPCRIDRHNSCLEHGYFGLGADQQCPMGRAHAALVAAGRGGGTHV